MIGGRVSRACGANVSNPGRAGLDNRLFPGAVLWIVRGRRSEIPYPGHCAYPARRARGAACFRALAAGLRPDFPHTSFRLRRVLPAGALIDGTINRAGIRFRTALFTTDGEWI
jgi:hypothetical protein